MTISSAPRRRLSSSPFRPAPEPVIATYELDQLVSHDLHGMGRVIAIDPSGVTVDFRPQVVRVASPYAKLSHL